MEFGRSFSARLASPRKLSSPLGREQARAFSAIFSFVFFSDKRERGSASTSHTKYDEMAHNMVSKYLNTVL